MVAIAAVSRGDRDRPTSTPKLGLFVYILASAAVIGGFLFGYDTSVVSAAMLYIPEAPGLKPMNTVWQEILVSISPGMAAVGSLMSGVSSDRFGRRKVILGASFIFTVGALVCAASVNKIMLLIGRILLGIAIGFASMIVPVYLGETAPTHVRGMLVSAFALMISGGQVVANVTGGAFSYIAPYTIGWRLMFAFAAVPSAIQFVCFIFLPETPRWLYEHGYEQETREVLEKVYNGDNEWVEFELEDIMAFTEDQKKDKMTPLGQTPILWRILRTPHVLKACFIGSMLQAFQQLAGINTILYYTADIIRSSGVSDNHTTIWISVALSVCNFIGPFVPMSLIERVGRRILFLFSCAAVVVALILIGVAFLLVNHDSAATFSAEKYAADNAWNSSFADAKHCMEYTNCDFCVTTDACGFCHDPDTREGFCLPASDDPSFSSSTGECSRSAKNASSTNAYKWQKYYCNTRFTLVPIFVMGFYLLTFSSGFTSLPWVLNSEFYPMWARSTCVSISTLSNWVFNLIIALTYLSLTQVITKYGAFWLYAGFTAIAFLFIYFLVPETKGYSIDEVEMLFMSKKKRRATVSRRRETLTEIRSKLGSISSYASKY
ncbi:unnamed protein product [Caenorhabditis bovis]|uniref:Major facilitator superfamily (MFS) profile domain-containing protein n=1 Tax=Caenorhabditis bovis TaxID=2654633 RepID=A0A8S1E9N6_9PELO|nr:unnamed protein product [Caenorhabditis bovis]